MPAIISIILIRLDQFIIAVWPCATPHLNEFTWKGKKTAQIAAHTCGHESTRAMSQQWIPNVTVFASNYT